MSYKFNILDTKALYQGFNNIELFTFQFEKFDKSLSEPITRELSRRKPCTGMLPYDPKSQEVILIEQIRVGPLANNQHPWLYEIVAGMIEDNEDKDTTILREAKEEANCVVSKLIPIYEYYMTPGWCNETLKLYCGITDTTNAGGIFGVADEGEDIKAHKVKIEDAFDMLKSGKIINASTIIALQWLMLNYKSL